MVVCLNCAAKVIIFFELAKVLGEYFMPVVPYFYENDVLPQYFRVRIAFREDWFVSVLPCLVELNG